MAAFHANQTKERTKKMSNEIWKYKISDGVTTLQMPEGATILSVQNQMDTICIWAYGRPSAKKEPRIIHIIGTGIPLIYEDILNVPFDDFMKFIGTVQTRGGQFVWHVFEDISESLLNRGFKM
jgi:hypothetical protein|tara:strand:+ start:2467 stop:2835 length:369 start_codon:yes stop_codon:yes gene_type:complete